MEITNRVVIKKTLERNNDISLGLMSRLGTSELETAIKSLSEKTSLSPGFIKMNLGIIRNWI